MELMLDIYAKYGNDIYFFVNCFFVYSFIGWIFECIVISYEERSLVNRGFVRGPLCTIYGVGALGVYFLFQPIADNKLLLFVFGAVVATLFEIFVGVLMLKLFGSFWWNYDNKRFNYKGIICLESTICWGVMTMLTFIVFQPIIARFVNLYFDAYGKTMAILFTLGYSVDFITSFYKAWINKHTDEEAVNEIEKFG